MLKIAISIDDAREDAVRAYREILKPLCIPITLNVTTGYVRGENKVEDNPSDNKPMSLSQLTELAAEPEELIEFGGHGIKHNNDFDNLIAGVKDLNSILEPYEKTVHGIASPQSKLHTEEILEHKEELESIGVRYFRTGDRKEHMSFMRRAFRKANRYIHIPYIYSTTDEPQFVYPEDDFILYSVCVLRNSTIKELMDMVRRNVKNRQIEGIILNFHSVLKPGEEYYEDLYSYDYGMFKHFIEWLKHNESDNKLELVKTLDIKKFD